MTLVKRNVCPVAVDMMHHFAGIVIEGARQTGKSTLSGQLAAPDAVILNLDHDHIRDAAIADPTGFVAQANSRQLVIDEVQRVPQLTLAVKAVIDHDRRPGRFILTGSSDLLRVRGTADSLAGRVARLTMYGFSQGELMGVRDDLVTAVRNDAQRLTTMKFTADRESYAKVLGVGGYPEVQEISDRMRSTWIDSYLQGIIGRDLSLLRREVRPARAMSVLRALAGRQSAELVKSKLAEHSAVPPSTITSYLDLLHDVGLVVSIPPWTPNLAKREIGRPKTLIVDAALAIRLARLTPAQLIRLEYREAFGALIESFVVAELLKQRTWSQVPFDIFHYRDRDGDEVDIVIELEDGSIIGIEVKSSTSFAASQFKGLVRMRDRLGDRFVAGLVLNTGSSGYRYADRLYGASVSALWEFR